MLAGNPPAATFSTRRSHRSRCEILENSTAIRPDRAAQGDFQHRLEPQGGWRHVLSCVEAATAFARGKSAGGNFLSRRTASVALQISEKFTAIRPARAAQGVSQHHLEPQDRLGHVLSCVEAAAAFARGKSAGGNFSTRRTASVALQNFRKVHSDSPRSRCAGSFPASPRATRPSGTCVELC